MKSIVAIIIAIILMLPNQALCLRPMAATKDFIYREFLPFLNLDNVKDWGLPRDTAHEKYYQACQNLLSVYRDLTPSQKQEIIKAIEKFMQIEELDNEWIVYTTTDVGKTRRMIEKEGFFEYLEARDIQLGKLKSTLLQYLPQIRYDKVISFNSLDETEKIKLDQDIPYLVTQYKNKPILYFIFADRLTQGLALDRLAIFVEIKPGPVDSDEELSKTISQRKWTGFGGHDYTLKDIARFFTEAEQSIVLNMMEIRIRDELLASKYLIYENGAYKANGDAAVISTTQYEPRFVREHELNHAIYFTDEDYRKAVQALWKSLSDEDEDKEFIKNILSFSCYYFEVEDLLIREFAAYFRDFEDLINRRLKAYGEMFLSGNNTEGLDKIRQYFTPEWTL
ncbi:MAG: hypothetical protein V2A72_07200 [Candidatus Omnitrophota bacterium]